MKPLALLPLVLAAACGSPAAEDPGLAIDLAGSLQNPCWSPDGAELAVTAFAGGYSLGRSAIAIAPAAGGAARVLMDAADNVNPSECWNAATNAIVFLSSASGVNEVWWMRPDGTGRRRVTNRPGKVAFAPSLSPDGRTIVFESHRQDDVGSGSIWTVGTDGMGLTQLTTGSDDRKPVWSPQGDRIVFQSSSGGDWDLWAMTPTGDELAALTGAPADDVDPSWSPDGTRIVFSSNQGGLGLPALFVIPAAGGAARRVTDRDEFEGAPAWSPDGAQIAFASRADVPVGSPGTSIRLAAAP